MKRTFLLILASALFASACISTPTPEPTAQIIEKKESSELTATGTQNEPVQPSAAVETEASVSVTESASLETDIDVLTKETEELDAELGEFDLSM